MIKKKTISILTISLASGGAEKVISLLLPELVKSYNVHLVLFYNVIHFNIPEEVNTVILNDNESDAYSRKILNFPRFIGRYLQFVRQYAPDLSISFLTRPNLINGIIKMRFPDLKVIMSERGYPSINYRSSKFRYRLYKLLVPVLYNKADIVFSNSISINQDLRKNFKVKKPLKVIYNPVNLEDQKKRFSSGHLKLITVGSLRPIKNQSLIFESIRNLPNIQLTILGDGQLRDELEQKVHEFGISDRVVFEGIVKDVDKYLKKQDCFILSSNSEGFPNVILEAMANGLPVISTNCLSGPLEILNDNKPVHIKKGDFVEAQFGLLVNVGDSEGLEKAIVYLQDHREMLENYGNLGYERAKNYNVESIYTAFEKMIEEV